MADKYQHGNDDVAMYIVRTAKRLELQLKSESGGRVRPDSYVGLPPRISNGVLHKWDSLERDFVVIPVLNEEAR